jgi:predicted Zn-dependent protease with MMP-like domain
VLPSGPQVRHVPFEELVGIALDGLPPEIHTLLNNVAVVIEDEPTPEQLRSARLRDRDTMYGLYEGISGVSWGASYYQGPNKITIFRLPLEEDFADPHELAREVQRTVLHELGHHAGLNHSRLNLLGLGNG